MLENFYIYILFFILKKTYFPKKINILEIRKIYKIKLNRNSLPLLYHNLNKKNNNLNYDKNILLIRLSYLEILNSQTEEKINYNYERINVQILVETSEEWATINMKNIFKCSYKFINQIFIKNKFSVLEAQDLETLYLKDTIQQELERKSHEEMENGHLQVVKI